MSFCFLVTQWVSLGLLSQTWVKIGLLKHMHLSNVCTTNRDVSPSPLMVSSIYIYIFSWRGGSQEPFLLPWKCIDKPSLEAITTVVLSSRWQNMSFLEISAPFAANFLCLLRVFLVLLPECSLSLREGVIVVPLLTGHSAVTCSQHFRQLWVSAVTTDPCKRKVSDQSWPRCCVWA